MRSRQQTLPVHSTSFSGDENSEFCKIHVLSHFKHLSNVGYEKDVIFQDKSNVGTPSNLHSFIHYLWEIACFPLSEISSQRTESMMSVFRIHQKYLKIWAISQFDFPVWLTYCGGRMLILWYQSQRNVSHERSWIIIFSNDLQISETTIRLLAQWFESLEFVELWTILNLEKLQAVNGKYKHSIGKRSSVNVSADADRGHIPIPRSEIQTLIGRQGSTHSKSRSSN
jgi:hypothetical protein